MTKSKQQPVTTGEREAQITALKAKYKDILEPVRIEPVSQDKVLATPSSHINELVGNDAGVRAGSVVLWYGPEGSLKTWTALEMCREAQKKWPDKIVAYIDAEFRVQMDVATKIVGVNTDPFDTGVPRFIYRRTNVLEDVWQMVNDFAKTEQFSLIVVDSITVLRLQKRFETNELKGGALAAAASWHSDNLPIICTNIEQTGTILWVISQERTGEINTRTGVSTVTFTGGKAIGYCSTHIFRTRKLPKEWETPERDLEVWIERNKYGLNLRKTVIPVVLGQGINVEGDLITHAEEYGIIRRSGAYYYLGDAKIGQGLANASQFLRENPDLQIKIREELAKVQKESEDST